MANQRHLGMLLDDGVVVWNRWRAQDPATQPDLSNTNLLSQADLRAANLFGANLRGASLRGANLRRADLMKADLRDATLIDASLSSANLREADLRRADCVRASLFMADLRLANAYKVNLYQADLRGANLYGAILQRAWLREAELSDANLYQATLRKANLYSTDLTRAHLCEADLTSADLTGAMCLQTDFRGATLTNCAVYGISAWDVNLEGAVQSDLHIIPFKGIATITVDNMEVAQFLYLLLHNEKMRSVLDMFTSKVVLILGRFGEHKPVLDALRAAFRQHPNGYIPVMFDFEPPHEKPVLETVKTLAHLARFVIADLTDPNMIRSELSYITSNALVPVAPLIEGNAKLPTEYADWKAHRSFLPVYRYMDVPHLLSSLNEAVIVPVEAHVQARHLADADSL